MADQDSRTTGSRIHDRLQRRYRKRATRGGRHGSCLTTIHPPTAKPQVPRDAGNGCRRRTTRNPAIITNPKTRPLCPPPVGLPGSDRYGNQPDQGPTSTIRHRVRNQKPNPGTQQQQPRHCYHMGSRIRPDTRQRRGRQAGELGQLQRGNARQHKDSHGGRPTGQGEAGACPAEKSTRLSTRHRHTIQ